MKFIPIAFLLIMLVGCSKPYTQGGYLALAHQGTYGDVEPLRTSLFSSDQSVISDEAVAKILESKIILPASPTIAVMQFPSSQSEARARYLYGSYYSRTEEYQETQQSVFDDLHAELAKTTGLGDVALMPSMMVPANPDISILRSAAVRMQCDMLLLYRITSDRYYDSRAFKKDLVKAFCTVETILLDIRTGVIPFTLVVTEQAEDVRVSEDYDSIDAQRRVELMATRAAMTNVGGQIAAYLNSVERE